MRSSGGGAALTLDATPGPLALQSAAELALDTLSGAALLDLAAEVERSLSWAAALRAEVIAAYASRGPGDPHDETSQHDHDWHRERLAAACQTSPHEAHVRTDTALALAGRLPLTRAALASGSLPWAQAVALARESATLDLEQSAAVERQILADPRAVSVAQVARATRTAIAALLPSTVAEQTAAAVELRSLQMWPDRDIPGLICLQARLPTDAAALIAAALDALATVAGPDDQRTAAQRRADALLDLTTGAQPPTATVQVLVPVGRGPATIDGQPIPDTVLRRWGCSATLTVSPLTPTGAVGPTAAEHRRAPSPAMRRRLEARDGHCRFPGCPTRARRCHAHHLTHWADGGPTTDTNLALLCSRHHHAVHDGGWQLTGPATDLHWTDHHGRTYQTPPDTATIPPWPHDTPLTTHLHPDPPDPPRNPRPAPPPPLTATTNADGPPPF